MKKRVLSAFACSAKRNLTLTIVVVLVMITSAFVHQHGRNEVRIELTTTGFAPSEVQHAPGKFAIAVENNALSGEYRLMLKAEDGTVLNEFQVQKGSSAWTVTLQTGRYTLTEASHPQWMCGIAIQ